MFDVCKEYREFQLRRKDILHISLHINIRLHIRSCVMLPYLIRQQLNIQIIFSANYKEATTLQLRKMFSYAKYSNQIFNSFQLNTTCMIYLKLLCGLHFKADISF